MHFRVTVPVTLFFFLMLSLASAFTPFLYNSWVKNIIRSSSTLPDVINPIQNTDEFNTLINESNGIVIVDFQKSKCTPCQKVAPLFQALAEKYEGKLTCYKVDADSSKDALAVLKANSIRSVPTFHLFKDGKLVDSVQGAHLDELEELLASNL